MSLRYSNARYSQDRGREVAYYFRDRSRQHATVRQGHMFWKTIAIVVAKWMKQHNSRTAQKGATKLASLNCELREEITQVASNKQRTRTIRKKERKKGKQQAASNGHDQQEEKKGKRLRVKGLKRFGAGCAAPRSPDYSTERALIISYSLEMINSSTMLYNMLCHTSLIAVNHKNHIRKPC